MNPPYGLETGAWMRKIAEHGDGIALVFARPDTKWFQEHGATADVTCFVSGRIKFFRGNTNDRAGTPGAGSMLLAWGPKASAALLSAGLGACFARVHAGSLPPAG
ncbi:hypothetical protein GCM10025864_35970 [Luteimicrobium album]|uniref:Adenine methyltransferase n=2 Tax=Luteimicrobium album TaxID=1054550 RepID=A0ABQ6I7B4_9MICO|nr:hypothetical protein GCM10025864_35970 [Luteimicrobium album]